MKDVLIKALELIQDQDHWTQYAFARDRQGRMISPQSPDAVKFCAFGAIECASGIKPLSPGWNEYTSYLNAVAANLFNESMVMVNDDNGNTAEVHNRVIQIYEEAIRNATDS